MNALANKIIDIVKQHLEYDEKKVYSELEKLCSLNILNDLYSIYQKLKNKEIATGNKNFLNSFVAYLLGITTLKPTKEFAIEKRKTYGRSGFPDIDMDFDYSRRDEIVQYLRHKYGEDCVGNIGTHQTLKSRNAIRRAIQVLDPDRTITFVRGKKSDRSANFHLQNRILETLPIIMKKRNGTMIKNLQEAYEMYEDFRKEMDNYPEVFRVAKAIEGSLSAYSIHPAGVLLSPVPLQNICPLHTTRGVFSDDGNSTKALATQFTMNEVEALGLIKFDVLGLSTKAVINLAKKTIKENHNVDVDLTRLPLDDPQTLNLLTTGDTVGCFQAEEIGMQETFKSIGIDSFDDLVIAIAMYRPGPMDYISVLSDYKKHPSKIKYMHPDMKKITEKTYGILVYQESIMRVSMEMAGFTASDGYSFMKGCAKKKGIEQWEDVFRQGCRSKGISDQVINNIWSDVVRFGSYAFNMSLSFSEKIITSEKEYTVQELYNIKRNGGHLPKAYNQFGKKIEIVDVYDHGIIPVWEIKFSDGSVHKCTMQHKFLTSNGVVPLSDIIKHKLGVIKYAQKERLGVQGLSSSVSKSSNLHSTQKNMSKARRIKTAIKDELYLSGMFREVYSVESCKTQEDLSTVDCPEEKEVLCVRKEEFSNFLGHNETKSRTNKMSQSSDQQICFRFSYEQSHREKKKIFINEGIKSKTLSFISKKQNRHSYQNFVSSRHTRIQNKSVKRLERKQSRRFLFKMRERHYGAKNSSFPRRTISKANIAAARIQIQSICVPPQIYHANTSSSDRFFKHGSKNINRNRWTSSLQARMGQTGKNTKRQRRRAEYSYGRTRLSNYQNIIRHLAPSRGSIQIHGISGVTDVGSVLHGKGCREKYWQVVQITDIRYIGQEQCYDIEVASEDHLYCLSSGIVNSNSHSTAYGYECFKTGYLKSHYMIEFMCARLSVETQRRQFEHVSRYEIDLKKHGIKILPPDINRSKLIYTKTGEKEVLRPLIFKEVGDKAAEDIVANQPYKGDDLVYSFAMKVGSVNSKAFEALLDNGVFGKINKAKALHDFDIIRRDKNKLKGRQHGNFFK